MKYQYDGKGNRPSFGPYPFISLAAAREKRDAAGKRPAEGTDPAVAEKLKIQTKIEADRNTFEKIDREWHQTPVPFGAIVCGPCRPLPPMPPLKERLSAAPTIRDIVAGSAECFQAARATRHH